jgi:hypothetical protein
MKMNALIRSNLGINAAILTPMEFAEAYSQAIWLEQWRLQQQAELLAAMFGAKKNK